KISFTQVEMGNPWPKPMPICMRCL
ncbi:Uncharacterized protein conserved in cyanobacteria, partial [Gloeomargarita lithophora Alchichica-D10]